MSYKIGQIRKNNNTRYLERLSWLLVEGGIPTKGYASANFLDYAILLLNNQKFNANNTYYLRFTLNRIHWDDPRWPDWGGVSAATDPHVMSIRLELFKNRKDDGEYLLGTYQVIETAIKVEPYMAGVNSLQFSFETIFTPNDTYSYLGFILARTQLDYTVGQRNDIKGNIDFDNNGDLCTVNNILLPVREYVDKIGIQSRPGSLVCINREAMRIGRSGTLLINNGVPISFVGFVGPNGDESRNIDKFILDYAWNQ